MSTTRSGFGAFTDSIAVIAASSVGRESARMGYAVEARRLTALGHSDARLAGFGLTGPQLATVRHCP